jgi:hypothetical protein
MSNDRSGFPGMETAVRHLVWVVSGWAKVQSAATAPVGASDTAPNKTAGIAPDRHIDRRPYAVIDFLLSLFNFLVSGFKSRFATGVQRF